MSDQQNQLVPLHDSSPAGSFRSTLLRYQNAKSVWHVVVPIGLGALAAGALNWAFNMLSQDEYGVAMLLTLFFLIIGIGASIAITRRLVRFGAVLTVVGIALFSGVLVWQKKGDKPWTTLRTGAVWRKQPQVATEQASETKPSLRFQVYASKEPYATGTQIGKIRWDSRYVEVRFGVLNGPVAIHNLDLEVFIDKDVVDGVGIREMEQSTLIPNVAVFPSRLGVDVNILERDVKEKKL